MRLVSRPASLAASSTALPKPPMQLPFFHGDHERRFAHGSGDHFGVDRLDEPHVHHADFEALIAQLLRGAEAIGQQRAAAEDHAIASPRKNLRPAEFDGRALSPPIRSALALG